MDKLQTINFMNNFIQLDKFENCLFLSVNSVIYAKLNLENFINETETRMWESVVIYVIELKYIDRTTLISQPK